MDIEQGKYKHYKGPLYEVLGTARHSETEEWMVVYKTLYADFSTWVRPYDMFVSTVEIDGVKVARFKKIEDAV